MVRWFGFLVALAVAAQAERLRDVLPAGYSPAPAAQETGPPPFRTFRLTKYWIAELKPARDVGVPVFDEQGRRLALLSLDHKKELDLHGTGEFVEGPLRGTRISWLDPERSARGFYRVLPAGVWATGPNRKLRPLRAVAADLGTAPWKDYCTRDGPLIPRGTRLRVRELEGLPLPDGSIHDGVVEAVDSGSNVYGLHLDLFCGYRRWCPEVPDYVTVTFKGVSDIPPDYKFGLRKRRSDRDPPYFCERPGPRK